MMSEENIYGGVPENLGEMAVSFLKEMIKIPSYSTQEARRADFVSKYLHERGIVHTRLKNNIIAYSKYIDPDKPVLMINSHLDTVKPVDSYTFDPFNPPQSDTHIYGLGSNDAGGCVAALVHTFMWLYDKKLKYNIMLALSCEEEISGSNGMDLIVDEIRGIDLAIIGEPTGMKAAIAERGLLVLDGTAFGKSGHAARNEGINSLYIAIEDIEKMRSYKFTKVSPRMGEVKLTVTQISAGTQHNVVPETCNFVVDIRPTEQYTNAEILELLSQEVKSELRARSLTNRSSATPLDSPLILSAEKLGIEQYTSPTTSDWMRIDIPAVKMGPGESARSHRADEYVLIEEVRAAVPAYVKFIENLDYKK